MPSILTVRVDTREQRPLSFPKTLLFHVEQRLYAVRTVRRKLPAGDYALEHALDAGRLETKRSLDELWGNLTSDYARFARSLDRLADSCAYPFLVLDVPLSALNRPTVHCPRPTVVHERLLDECLRRRITLLACDSGYTQRSRVAFGEFCLRVLLVSWWRWRAPQPQGTKSILETPCPPVEPPS